MVNFRSRDVRNVLGIRYFKCALNRGNGEMHSALDSAIKSWRPLEEVIGIILIYPRVPNGPVSPGVTFPGTVQEPKINCEYFKSILSFLRKCQRWRASLLQRRHHKNCCFQITVVLIYHTQMAAVPAKPHSHIHS